MRFVPIQHCPHLAGEGADEHPIHPGVTCPAPAVHIVPTEEADPERPIGEDNPPSWRPPPRPEPKVEATVEALPPYTRAGTPTVLATMPRASEVLLQLAHTYSYACGYPGGDGVSIGQCASCGRVVRVKADGELSAHKVNHPPCKDADAYCLPESVQCAACGMELDDSKVKRNGKLKVHRRPSVPCGDPQLRQGTARPRPVESVVARGNGWVAVWEDGEFIVGYAWRKRITSVVDMRKAVQ